MLRLRSAAGGQADLSEMFGTTERHVDVLPPGDSDFTLTRNPRELMLRFRIKQVIPTTLNVTPSIVCIADDMVTKSGVVFKIFLQMRDDVEGRLPFERLLYETKVYRYVTNELSDISRLFVPWHNTYHYKTEDIAISLWDPADLNNFREEMKKSGHYESYKEFYTLLKTIPGHIDMLFTQITRYVPKDYTFMAFVRLHHDQDDLLRDIIFQVIFALACMAELGIQHNDLHINNILVGFELPRKPVGYFFKGSLFIVKQFLQVRLFDWDSAFVASIGLNGGLTETIFGETGIGNVWNPRYDIYTFVSSIENIFKFEELKMPVEVARFIAAVRPIKYGRSDDNVVRMCLRDPKTNQCSSFPPGQPSSVLTPQQALNLPYFDEYRVSAPLEKTAEDGVYNIAHKSMQPKKGFFSRFTK